MNNIVTTIGYHISQAAANVVKTEDKIPGINDGNTAPKIPNGFENVAMILGWVRWGALIVCIAALIAFFGHLAMERQNGGGGQGSMGWLGKILVAIIGISAAITLVGLLVPTSSN